ncbi:MULTISPECIES: RCC1 domain-containing protein [Sorangium]|uniref:RCC1 domain-containing protein n=1 Tax=Sorangium TaxID=39643 RepID=UPI00101AAD70|nr:MULTISPECIES: RCC1 domain-containing protein [Sorangium]
MPVALPRVEGIVQLADGGFHLCGLLGSGNVVCWGTSTGAPLLGVEGVGRTTVPVSAARWATAPTSRAASRSSWSSPAGHDVVVFGL